MPILTQFTGHGAWDSTLLASVQGVLMPRLQTAPEEQDGAQQRSAPEPESELVSLVLKE